MSLATAHIQRASSTYDEIASIIGRKQKMLVVDDDQTDVLLLQRKLVKVSIEWDVAYSVQDAIGLLKQHEYFLVWIDLAMPKEGGSVLVKWMSERKDEHGHAILMRRVVCTASTKSDELDKALKYGPLALMSKDFTPEHFLQLLYLVNMPHLTPEYANA